MPRTARTGPADGHAGTNSEQPKRSSELTSCFARRCVRHAYGGSRTSVSCFRAQRSKVVSCTRARHKSTAWLLLSLSSVTGSSRGDSCTYSRGSGLSLRCLVRRSSVAFAVGSQLSLYVARYFLFYPAEETRLEIDEDTKNATPVNLKYSGCELSRESEAMEPGVR